jgi:hypothetical protein
MPLLKITSDLLIAVLIGLYCARFWCNVMNAYCIWYWYSTLFSNSKRFHADPTAAHLLGLRVRISSGAWVSVSCEFFGSGLCDGLITRPEKSYRPWCVSEYDGGISYRGSRPIRAIEPGERKMFSWFMIQKFKKKSCKTTVHHKKCVCACAVMSLSLHYIVVCRRNGELVSTLILMRHWLTYKLQT